MRAVPWLHAPCKHPSDMLLEERLEWLSERHLILMFLWEERFWNPLIPKQREILTQSGLLDKEEIQQIIHEHLPAFYSEIPQGMYFPTPIARELQNREFSPEMVLPYHYDFIEIDEQRIWTMNGKKIIGKVQQLFESHLFFETETERYFVEYWSDVRWDKCYLRHQLTPMLGLKWESNDQELHMQLNNGNQDKVDLHTIRLDSAERCFVQTEHHGEIMLADAPRYWLLEKLDDSGASVTINSSSFSIEISN